MSRIKPSNYALITSLKQPKPVRSSEIVVQVSKALQPFVSEFKRWKAKSGMNSKSRREWNERMPDSFPLKLTLTMGDWRRAEAALHNAELSHAANEKGSSNAS